MWTNTVSEKLLKSILEVTGNRAYAENQRKVQEIIHEYGGMDETVYWIEYVVKHGSNHLMIPGVHTQQWWDVLMLDVLLFYTALSVTLGVLIYKCVRRVCCGRRKVKSE